MDRSFLLTVFLAAATGFLATRGVSPLRAQPSIPSPAQASTGTSTSSTRSGIRPGVQSTSSGGTSYSPFRGLVGYSLSSNPGQSILSRSSVRTSSGGLVPPAEIEEADTQSGSRFSVHETPGAAGAAITSSSPFLSASPDVADSALSNEGGMPGSNGGSSATGGNPSYLDPESVLYSSRDPNRMRPGSLPPPYSQPSALAGRTGAGGAALAGLGVSKTLAATRPDGVPVDPGADEPLILTPDTDIMPPPSVGHSTSTATLTGNMSDDGYAGGASGMYGSIGSIGKDAQDSGVAGRADAEGGGESRVSDFFLNRPSVRNGCFQGFDSYIEHIPTVGSLQSGMTTFYGAVHMAAPFPDTDHPLVISPNFRWSDYMVPDWFQDGFGRKLGLYTAGLNLDYFMPFSDCFLLDARVGVHWSSDFKVSSKDALRITGHLVGVWKLCQATRIMAGASYQNVSDLVVVPIFGVSWKPSEDCYLDACFPNSKLARRITWMKGIREIEEGNSPYWMYVSTELNDGKWAFKPDGPDRDLWGPKAVMSYYDYRVLGGLERKVNGDVCWALEGGLVFARHVKFEGTSPTGNWWEKECPKASALARLRVSF